MCFFKRPIFIGLIIYFLIFFDILFKIEKIGILIIPLFLLSFLLVGFLTRCPKCSTWITSNPNAKFGRYNAFLPFYNKYCKKCGQNLDKCNIESDEIT